MTNDSLLQLEILDIGVAVRTMLSAIAEGHWPMQAKIYGHCSSMLHRADLKLRADAFVRRSS